MKPFRAYLLQFYAMIYSLNDLLWILCSTIKYACFDTCIRNRNDGINDMVCHCMIYNLKKEKFKTKNEVKHQINTKITKSL